MLNYSNTVESETSLHQKAPRCRLEAVQASRKRSCPSDKMYILTASVSSFLPSDRFLRAPPLTLISATFPPPRLPLTRPAPRPPPSCRCPRTGICSCPQDVGASSRFLSGVSSPVPVHRRGSCTRVALDPAPAPAQAPARQTGSVDSESPRLLRWTPGRVLGPILEGRHTSKKTELDSGLARVYSVT